MRKLLEIETAFSPRSALDGRTSFFLVGIGGAGMSAVARMLRSRGFDVSGSDSTQSPETDRLQSEGIVVHLGHSRNGLAERHALIVSDAIDLRNSPEIAAAKEFGCPIVRRSQALGWVLQDRKVIAVTGTHGKTTTTGMISSALRSAGLDPLIVVGAQVPEFGSPVVDGEGAFAVVEACEAYDSFHDLDPFFVVLTNLELDHIDFHGTYERLRESVLRFVSRIPAEGCLIYCEEDAGACEVAALFEGRKIGYRSDSFSELPGAMALPGRHNFLNAMGALCAAREVGAELDEAWAGICAFTGAERRLQVLQDSEIVVVDDYAHHPREVAASLQALREKYPTRRLVVVYQPHLYSRTEQLIPEFAEALSMADEIVLTDIYPAREAPIPGVSSARIAELVKGSARYISQRHLLARRISPDLRAGDVVVGMGAGNISEFAPALIEELRRISNQKALGGSGEASKKVKVTVVYGGDSAEREVSLHSGLAIYDALVKLGYEAEAVDVSEILLKSGDLSRFTGASRPDLVFLAVHGTHAEDGAIQGLFELLSIPYTGSKIQSSAIAMDKTLTKQILAAEGIVVPPGVVVQRSLPGSAIDTKPIESSAGGSSDQESIEQLPFETSSGYIVKPNAEGSTVGLSFVEDEAGLPEALRKAWAYDGSAIVEEWIRGMEISVPVLGGRALPPVEIVPKGGKYDFASKYLPGATEEIVPARLPEDVLNQAMEIAVRCHELLKCEGATRTDMMVRDEHEIFVLEVNTLPGMTGTSLLPNSALAAGISFEELVDMMVKEALGVKVNS